MKNGRKFNKKEIKDKNNKEEIEENLKEKQIERQEPKILNVSIWRIFYYFIIYSFIGFVIETLFALVNYGVFESRQSFLYGPFCAIYGVGAVIIILVLKYKFFKNNHTLFIGGFIVGSCVEYLVSLFGEMILNVKWWDYSNRFLNINGRICFLYSLFWGLLGVYLLRVINPRIDKFIDWMYKKWNHYVLNIFSCLMIVLLFIDCLVSAYAIEMYLVRTIVEKDISISNEKQVEELYNEAYSDEEKVELINKYFNNEKMVKTYPNLTITLKDGTLKRVRDYYPDLKYYYYKFDVERNL